MKRRAAASNFGRRALLATWTALNLQARRRRRAQAAAIAAPVITSAVVWWENTTPGWFDVELFWTFDHRTQPVATMEILCGVDGGAAAIVGSVASDAPGWLHVMVSQAESALLYQVRYHHGFDVGPTSAAYPVQLTV